MNVSLVSKGNKTIFWKLLHFEVPHFSGMECFRHHLDKSLSLKWRDLIVDSQWFQFALSCHLLWDRITFHASLWASAMFNFELVGCPALRTLHILTFSVLEDFSSTFSFVCFLHYDKIMFFIYLSYR